MNDGAMYVLDNPARIDGLYVVFEHHGGEIHLDASYFRRVEPGEVRWCRVMKRRGIPLDQPTPIKESGQ